MIAAATERENTMHDDLRRFIAQAWEDHVEDDRGVALRLPHALDQVDDTEGLMALARLAVHVYGEHLARWADTLKFLAALARMPCFDPHDADGRTLRLMRAAVGLAAGESDLRGQMPASDRVVVGARAANLLALHDTARCRALFDESIETLAAAVLPGSDPAARALAVAGNNIASSLETLAGRDEAGTALMLRAAEAGRRWWGLAGTWLETERAEYRLALAWLAAGDAARARTHAQCCLAIIDQQPDAPAFERFYGLEALARAERAAGDAAAHAEAVAAAQATFGRLTAEDQAACRKVLDAL